jgi:hypothetical protein
MYRSSEMLDVVNQDLLLAKGGDPTSITTTAAKSGSCGFMVNGDARRPPRDHDLPAPCGTSKGRRRALARAVALSAAFPID